MIGLFGFKKPPQKEQTQVIHLVKWVIFQYDDVVKVAGVVANTGKFRISSRVSSITGSYKNGIGVCELQTSNGNLYCVHGGPCNISINKVFKVEVDKHVKQRSELDWSDVSYIGDTSHFDGDYK